MKTLIVYFSKYGNTRQIAEAIAGALEPAGAVRTVALDRLAAADFEGVDLIVAGSPTHGFTMPDAVRFALAALPVGILTDKAVAAFDTTVRPWPLRLFRASPKLLHRLRDLGGRPIARPQTFFVKTHNTQKTGDTALLLPGQIERAREWAAQLLEQAQA